jgi:eukaryotic-like serine/threonine-protein kinase
MDVMLAELERDFRDNWSGFDPAKYDRYLEQVDSDLKLDLLIRLLSAEIEFAYQPPVTFHHLTLVPTADEDDQRVKPNLRLFLLKFPELRQRVDGIIQLSVLEYALRIRFEEVPPNVSSYLDLCERDQDRLGGLLELTERKLLDSRPAEFPNSSDVAAPSASDSTVPESKSEKPILLDQLPCNLGCFLLIRQLGKGGMGNVYSAIDLRSTAHVAVKVMRHLDSWSIYRFVEEFSWLSQLNHPHLVKLYDAYSEGDIRYFSMEQVDGLTIRQWFQTVGLDESRWAMLRQVLAEAASAIRFLHDCEVIHRDVKPSNLMITPARRAMLLDLGLAMRSGKARESVQFVDGSKIVGTIQYLSPEALTGEPQTFASDWYSFGVLIYETITNSYPPIAIDPKNNDSSARYRINEKVLLEKLEGMPTDLSQLCVELLATDPKARPTGSKIIERLGIEENRAISFSAETCCLGRDQVLEELDSYFARKDSAAKLVLVRGESGIGKTTVVKHWISQIQKSEPGTLAFQIRCHLQDHTPLRALNMLAQQLVGVLPDLPEELWADLTESEGGEIIYGFPQMQQLVKLCPRPKDPSLGVTELAARRAAGLHALLHWLRKLSQRRSVVIAIDDAQWADSDSGRLLAQLFSPTYEFRGLLILIDQGDKVKSPLVESVVRGLEGQDCERHLLLLQPLVESVCMELLVKWSTRVGLELSVAIASNLVRRSGGNPFLLREVLSAYVNHIFHNKLEDEDWLRYDSGRNGGQHLQSRFSLLPMSMERVLQFLAIADEPLGFHQLQTVSRVLPNELLPLINYLASQGWIRINGTSLDSDLEIAHDRFRDIVLDSMPTERKHRRHYRLARTLSSESPPPWPRIAHHYWTAEHFREAAACYMQAARISARNNAFVEALWYLERANHPDADRTVEEQRNALRLRADCFAASGDWGGAIEAYQLLKQTATEEEEQTLLDCLTGEQWIRAGRLTKALDRLSVGLDQLRATQQKRRGWLPRWSTAKDNMVPKLLALKPDDSSQVNVPFSGSEQCLNRIGTPLAFLNLELGTKLVVTLAGIATERGTNCDRALAILRWATLLSLANRSTPRTTIRSLRLGRQLARSCGNSTAIAFGQMCTFLWLFMQGRFRKAMYHGEKSLALYRTAELANQWEIGFVQWSMLSHDWHLGDLTRLCEATQELRKQATIRGDAMWLFWMHSHSAHLADLILDNPQQGRRSIETAKSSIDRQPLQSPEFFLWMSEVRQFLYEGNPTAALAKLQSIWIPFFKSPLIEVVHYAWMVYSLKLCCHLSAIHRRIDRDEMIRAATQCIKVLRGLNVASFGYVAEAQTLVVDAVQGKLRNRSQWDQAALKLEAEGLILYALALRWHAKKYFPDDASAFGDPRATFQKLGAVCPEKLMDVILPLQPL